MIVKKINDRKEGGAGLEGPHKKRGVPTTRSGLADRTLPIVCGNASHYSLMSQKNGSSAPGLKQACVAAMPEI